MLRKLRQWSYWPLLVVTIICGIILLLTLIPDKYPHQPHNKNASAKAAEDTSQDIAAELVAYYTKVLAGFTAILSIVSISQIYFLIKADKRAAEASEEAARQFSLMAIQADTAAKQKEISREQFFADHRPKLVLKDVFFSSADGFGEVTFEISNVGETMAIVSGGFIALEFVSDLRQFKNAHGRILEPLDHDGFKAGHLRPFAIRTTDDTQKKLEFLRDTRGDGAARAAEMRYGDPAGIARSPLFFFGVVRYTDGRGEEFGPTRVCVFRREWKPEDASFCRTGNPDHEYSD